MFRYRVPIVIRALALFLASLPVARLSVAGATGAHGLGTLPVHEAQVPPGASWVPPAPEVIVVTAVTASAVATGGRVTQRAQLHEAAPAQVTHLAARPTIRPDAGTVAARDPPMGLAATYDRRAVAVGSMGRRSGSARFTVSLHHYSGARAVTPGVRLPYAYYGCGNHTRRCSRHRTGHHRSCRNAIKRGSHSRIRSPGRMRMTTTVERSISACVNVPFIIW